MGTIDALLALPPDALVAWDRDIAPLLDLGQRRAYASEVHWLVRERGDSWNVTFEGWARSTSLWVSLTWRDIHKHWEPTFMLSLAEYDRERQLRMLLVDETLSAAAEQKWGRAPRRLMKPIRPVF